MYDMGEEGKAQFDKQLIYFIEAHRWCQETLLL